MPANGHSHLAGPTPSELLSSLSHWLRACSACGACTTVCPVYTLTRHEGHTARGHLLLIEHLIRTGETGRISPHFRDLLHDCLRCANCATVCPSHIPTVTLFEAARMVTARRQGHPRWWTLVRWALLDPHRRLPRLLSLARALLPLARRWEGSSNPSRRLLSSLAQSAFHRQKRAFSRQPGNGADPARREEVTMHLFCDCIQASFFPSSLECLGELASILGVRLIPAWGSACCGAAGLGVGDLDFLTQAIRRNLARFGDDELPIVVNNPTCLEMMRTWYPRLTGEEGKRLASRTVFGLALAMGPFLDPAYGQKVPLRVVLHDSCHGRNFFHTGEELRQVAGTRVKLLEPPLTPERACCGFGGSFLLEFPEQAAAMGSFLANALLELEPDLILSTNPACALSLRAALLRSGSNLPVLLPSQFLARLRPVGSSAYNQVSEN